jgi:hypothetical protein
MRAASQSDAEWSHLEGRAGATFVRHPDGLRYRVDVVAPGESVEHGALSTAAGIASAIATRGMAPYTVSNAQWVVVLKRKTGWWRRYRLLRRWNVLNGRSAGSLRDCVVTRLRSGDDVASIDGWPEWSRLR